MASVMYNAGKVAIFNGAVDLDTDTFYAMLVTSSYTADVDNHDFRNDVTNEVSGTGYTAGGKEITNPTVTQDDSNNRAVFDGDNLTWATSTITARGAVIYKRRGGAASADELICYIDFGSDKASNAGPFTITWNSDGIFAA